MPSIGLSIGRIHVRAGSAGSFAFTAPVLAFVSATDPDSDNTQDLLVTVSQNIGSNVIRLAGKYGSATVSEPYDVDEGGTDPEEDFEIPFAPAAIPDGLVAYVCWIESAGGTRLSANSNTISKTIGEMEYFAPRYFGHNYFGERYFG